jgi:hypothetical protein
MENNFARKFYKNVSVAALFLVIGAVLIVSFTNTRIPSWSLISLPILGLLVSFLSFLSAKSKSSKRNFSTLVSSLFGIKFFSYFIIALVFFLIERDKIIRLGFIGALFIVYLTNTIILLTSVLKYRNSQDSIDQQFSP